MPGYILSNNNRFYVATEQAYGAVAPLSADCRFFATKLGISESIDHPCRRVKTGTRTFGGWPSGLRRQTSFDLRTHLCGWTDQSREPSYGPLFRACLGGPVRAFDGGVIEAAPDSNTIRFTTPHGLSVGQAVTVGGEIRFVSAIENARTIAINAPFVGAVGISYPVGMTVSYSPGGQPGSVSLFDYWSPSTAVQRIVAGAAVDEMRLSVNGCYHEFHFKGPGRELIDNLTFEDAQGGLSAYPAEPVMANVAAAAVPGNLGQAWFGTSPDQFFTVTAAEIVLKNNLELRNREFGASGPRAVIAGEREITATFELYQEDEASSRALYQAARQRSPISVFLQMGQAPSQLFGVYLKSVVPDVPTFDDRELKLQWRFTNARAQGFRDDELVVAFG
ncbi:MAG: phage tail tube protein [Acidobacteria bacterium]|nr:phage tail tube protein [Acidobacteriota bacterium]